MPAFESIPPSASLAPAGPSMGPPPMPGGMAGGPPSLSAMGPGGGGLSQSVFQVKKLVRSLATAIPAAAQEISQIDRLLDAVMMKAIPGGGPAGPGGSNVLSQPADAPV